MLDSVFRDGNMAVLVEIDSVLFTVVEAVVADAGHGELRTPAAEKSKIYTRSYFHKN